MKSTRVDSEVNRAGMGSIQVPDDVKSSSKRYLIQKTQINDNDAGGRKYSNFTKKFGLLEKIRHLNAVTYRQLIYLAKDFEAKGPSYNYLRDTFYVFDSNADMIGHNAIQAAQILKNTCKAGTMEFDLNPETYSWDAKSRRGAGRLGESLALTVGTRNPPLRSRRALFVAKNIGAVVVADLQGCVIGMLSERDIIRAGRQARHNRVDARDRRGDHDE